MVDALKYVTTDPIFSLESHMETSAGDQVHCVLAKPYIYYPKSAKGYPCEINRFDENGIYQCVTEWTPNPPLASGLTSWNTPTMFKAFASKTWPAAGGGIYWSDRYLDEMEILDPVQSDPSYRMYTSCAASTPASLGGVAETRTYFVTQYPFGGDLATLDALVLDYRWGVNLSTLERNFYVQKYGWVQWETHLMVSGKYSLVKRMAYNLIKPGGAPIPQFPCGVPTI